MKKLDVIINGKLAGTCDSAAGKGSHPLFKDFDPWIEINGFVASPPSLNDNQKSWVNRLTINYSWYGETAQHALYATLQEPEMPDLPQNEFAQVLQAFASWALEQEDDK